VSHDRVVLEVQERGSDQRGSRTVRRLRKQGLIPGVLYGKGHSRAIAVGERELRTALTGPGGLHAIVDVVIEGQTTPHHAVLKDLQQHPVRGTVTHIDFHEVRLDQPIHAAVTVYLVGESVGVAEGGVLTQVVRELNVEALPMEIPERIEADVSALEIGGTLRLEELPAIEGVTFLDNAEETVIANVAAPRSEAELEELLAPTEAEEDEEGVEPIEGEAEGEAEIAGEAGEESPAAEAGDGSAPEE
jgi:large subunit ribosomal protein L25